MPQTQLNNAGPSWKDFIFPYVKSQQVFHCPSNSKKDLTSDTTLPILAHYSANIFGGESGASTGYNNFESYGAFGNQYFVGPTLSALTAPSQLIALAESHKEGNSPGVDFGASPLGGRNSPYMGHLATSNYLFADGHVKSLKWGQTFNTANGCTGSATLNMWHRANLDGSTALCSQMNLAVAQAKADFE